MGTGSKVQAWKPSPRWAALLEEPAPTEVPEPAWKPAWGFGARGADKAWNTPEEKPLPANYLH